MITRVPGLTYAPCKPTITICICLGAYYSVSSSIQNTALGNIGSIVAIDYIGAELTQSGRLIFKIAYSRLC